jgi:hypothetical protein
MTTITIVIAAIEMWKGKHTGLFVLDWAVIKIFRNERANDELKVDDKNKHRDLMAVLTQIRKWG